MLILIRCVLFFFCSMPLWSSTSWYTLDDKNQATLHVELFLSSTCPYCHKEQAYFTALTPQLPWIKVQYHIINQDKEALTLFNQLLIEQQLNDFAVPSAFFCNSRWVGFNSVQTTGKDLLKALVYCKEQVEKQGQLTSSTVETLNRWANANKVISGMTSQPSPLHYTLLVVLLDSFNPCALFGMAGFLAVLFLQHSRKNQLLSGCIYLGVVLLLHYFQQTQASAFFQLLPWLRWIALIVGVASLYLVFVYYKKQSIKPRLFFLWTFSFALVIHVFQQTCMMNWSYMFQQWIDNHSFSAGYKALLQSIYQLLYILPSVLILLFYRLLPLLKRFALIKRYLYRLSLLFIFIIALFLIGYPAAMSRYWLSFLIFSIATTVSVISCYFQTQKNNESKYL